MAVNDSFALIHSDLEKETEEINENHIVDTIMAKWLSSFMDEGLAEWEPLALLLRYFPS